MSDLLPCPFCGGAARAFKRTCDKNTPYDPADRAFPIVRCGACGACSEGDDWAEIQTAIDKWNRRAQPAQAVPSDVVRDAERYRFLRNEVRDWYIGPAHATYNDSVCEGEYLDLSAGGVALDSAIDAAIAAQGAKT